MSRRLHPGIPAATGVAVGVLHRVDRPAEGPPDDWAPPPEATGKSPGAQRSPVDGAAQGAGRAADRAAAHGGGHGGAEAGAGRGPGGGPDATWDPAAEPVESPAGWSAGGERIERAFDAVGARFDALARALRAEGAAERADIVEVAGLIARDPDLRGDAVARAAKGQPAAVAVRQAVEAQAAVLAGLADPTLADRAADVRQVGRRVLAVLAGAVSAPADGTPLVLAAHELGAADLLEPGRTVVAAVAVAGGPNSHAAIVARSLGIPLLLGVGPGVLDLPDGTEVVLDTVRAVAVSEPYADERASALAAIDAARERRERAAAGRHLPSVTADGRAVPLRANAATAAEAGAALAANAAGVGLLRTELPFLRAERWPTAEQHSAALEPVFAALAGQVVVARTLDFADDKLPPFLARGRSGRLGRGLPLMLAEPDAFAEQFRALLRAGADVGADLRIMIPMVAGLAELRACRALLDRAADRAGEQAPPLGVMVELPEAVEAADALAREADFLSIGSNDLTCQLLGLDRGDPSATPELGAHPVVLRAVDRVVRAAHAHGRQVSVCGDAAAHPLVAPLLVGLGVDSLSVSPAALDDIRALVRRLHHTACVSLAFDAMLRSSHQDVLDLVRHSAARPA